MDNNPRLARLIVFCDDPQKAADRLEHQYGIPHTFGHFITRSQRQMMGFSFLFYLPMRQLTAAEREYCDVHSIMEITVEGMQELQTVMAYKLKNQGDKKVNE